MARIGEVNADRHGLRLPFAVNPRSIQLTAAPKPAGFYNLFSVSRYLPQNAKAKGSIAEGKFSNDMLKQVSLSG